MQTTNVLLTPVISNYDPLEVTRIVPENDSLWVRVDIVIQFLLRMVTRRTVQLSLDLRTLLHR